MKENTLDYIEKHSMNAPHRFDYDSQFSSDPSPNISKWDNLTSKDISSFEQELADSYTVSLEERLYWESEF